MKKHILALSFGLLLLPSFTVRAGTTPPKEPFSEELYDPDYKDAFSEFPVEVRDYFRRAYSCSQYGSAEVRGVEGPELKDVKVKMKKLQCGQAEGDGKKLRSRFKSDDKIQEQFRKLFAAG